MRAFTQRLCRRALLHSVAAASISAAALVFLVLLGFTSVQASPFNAVPIEGMTAPAQPPLLRVSACKEDCPDCTDCVTEIDIVPHGEIEKEWNDPIGHELKKLAPIAAPSPEGACPPPYHVERRHHRRDGDSASFGCGIRCWYWRLRHGYCGPGCNYYRYRMHHYEKGYAHYQSRYACPS